MTTTKYSIPEIHARSILSTARKIEDGFHFSFDAFDPSKEHLVTYTQQADCPMFYQAMLALGKRPTATNLSNALREVFVFIDFSGIFDRPSTGRTAEMQEMAEHLFRPEGIVLNFGGADHRYVAFERSASMSRQSRMCFVREDVYLPLRERMMLGMTIGKCQLAKLYAYNGLLFTDGRRFDSSALLQDSHIVVIDNPKTVIKNARIITVEDDGTGKAVRKYHRVEKDADVEITEFDGEGLVSYELAKKMYDTEGHLHHSFQIRLPYIKGVVHEVDYKKLFRSMRLRYITDIWGVRHDIREVDMILTKSMFKGFGWMTENGLTWAEYLERCRKYDHALYVSGMDKIQKQDTTELNYQFLNTLDISNDAFRPGDLPLGWNRKPDTDSRQWVTKTMESAYYALVGDPVSQQKYFLKDMDAISDRRRKARAEIVRKNPLFLNEPIYSKELSTKAESLLADYSAGHLLVAGDNRYLSDDLMRLLAYIVKTSGGNSTALEKECLSGNTMYAPQPGYPACSAYTLLRSPHIARNEETAVVPLANVGKIRSKYLSHLHYVVMVDSRSLIPERLGGADFDGDMVKTIADPLLNQCVQKHNSLPVLKIPTAQPILADANDWNARFQTVKSTFSSRVGQISNAALRRGIVAYDEKVDEEMRNAAQEDTETLAILTGLEIDSAKSGIKPDLSEYLHSSGRHSSLFLRYKSITDDGKGRSWYEPTKNKRLQQYFANTAWAAVGSNLEKLPYFAYSLGQETRKVEFTPAADEELFSFASNSNWKNTLNPEIMERMASLTADYEEAQRRVRYLRHSPEAMKRRSDIDRILFARGQEHEYSTDTLYALFDLETPDRIHHARLQLTQQQWHLMPAEARKDFLFELFPTGSVDTYANIFCDFRCGGYRILGDILCDLDELHQNRQIQKHYLTKKGDSEALQFLLSEITDYGDYKAELVKRCIAVLQPPTARDRFDFEEAVQCAVALGKRNFVLEVLLASALPLVLDKSTPEPKKTKGAVPQMTNEWNEFLAYTQPVTYAASGKRDTTYLGRMTFATIQEQEGLSRILTILARGYLYHDANGEPLPDDPYTRVEETRNALYAWCSVPEKEPNPDCSVDFRHLSGSFPELVNEKGEGWYYRHVKNIIRFVRKNSNFTSKSAQKAVEGLAAGFTANWKKRVRQLQVPIFAPNTKGAWVLRFDDILADALEAGPLRKKAAVLPPETEEKLRQMDLNGVPYEIVRDVAEYYSANRAENEWVVLPVSNFDCYYGDTSFSKKWLSKIPKAILQREVLNGVCRIKLQV